MPGFIWFPEACFVEEEALITAVNGEHPRLASGSLTALPHAVQSICLTIAKPRVMDGHVSTRFLLVTLRDAANASWVGFFVVRAWIACTFRVARLQLHALVFTLLFDRCGAALPLRAMSAGFFAIDSAKPSIMS